MPAAVPAAIPAPEMVGGGENHFAVMLDVIIEMLVKGLAFPGIRRNIFIVVAGHAGKGVSPASCLSADRQDAPTD